MSKDESPELESLKKRLGISRDKNLDSAPKAGGKDAAAGISEEAGVDIRVILKTADHYRKKAIFENYLLSTIKVRDILSEGSGQLLYPGAEIYPEDLGLSTIAAAGDIKAAVQHVSWVSDGKNRAMIVVVTFERGGRVIDETVITGKSPEDIKATIRTILTRIMNRMSRGEQ